MKQASLKMQQRREDAIKAGAAELAHALEKSLVIRRFEGTCKCGLMLTDRDRDPKKKTVYNCPHCGRAGAPVVVSA